MGGSGLGEAVVRVQGQGFRLRKRECQVVKHLTKVAEVQVWTRVPVAT